MNDYTLAPGSDEAVAHGCKCPVVDNGYGKGAYSGAAKDDNGKPLFWINENCPLHWQDREVRK